MAKRHQQLRVHNYTQQNFSTAACHSTHLLLLVVTQSSPGAIEYKICHNVYHRQYKLYTLAMTHHVSSTRSLH